MSICICVSRNDCMQYSMCLWMTWCMHAWMCIWLWKCLYVCVSTNGRMKWMIDWMKVLVILDYKGYNIDREGEYRRWYWHQIDTMCFISIIKYNIIMLSLAWWFSPLWCECFIYYCLLSACKTHVMTLVNFSCTWKVYNDLVYVSGMIKVLGIIGL